MVLTTTAPAFVAASHAATTPGLLPERIRTAVAGLDAVVSTSACASRFDQIRQSL